jgi:hypothetical protein
MSRILCGAIALVAVTTLHVTAQQPNATGPRGATPRSSARATTTRLDPPQILPGTPSNVFSTIHGNALTASNMSLAKAFVRLRNARMGQIVETLVTDDSGLFAFSAVDPGSYIVEIVDARQVTVLAASQVLNAEPGEAISAVVKLPFFTAPLTGLLGTNSAAVGLGIVTAQAASAGVLTVQVTGAPTCEQVK